MAQGYNLNPINSDIYRGGNVQLDSSPYVRYALEAQFRRQARDDAFARSFQDLSSRITPAGMDGVDIDNFMKRKKEWQDYVIHNEKAYKNPALDNGQVYGEAMRRYNNVLGVIQESKDKLAALKPLQAIYADPKKRALLTEQAMMAAHNGTLPINDPNYQRFNVGAIDFNEAPFDAKQLQAFTTGIRALVAPSLKNKIYGQPRVDSKTNSKITPYIIKLTPSDYNNIRAQAATWSGVNSQFANFLDDELNNPNDYQTYNQVFKDHFGKDANIQSREDMATALALSQINSDLAGEESRQYTNTLGNQIYMQNMRQDDWYERERYKEEHGGGSGSLEGIVNGIYDAAVREDNKALQQSLGELYKGNGSEVFLGGTVNDKGQLVIRTQIMVNGKKRQVTKTYSADDPDLRNKLVGKVQAVFGSDTKLEKTEFNDKPKTEQPKKQNKSSNNKRGVLD